MVVFGMRLTLMSSGIATMIVVACLLVLILPLWARRCGQITGSVPGRRPSLGAGILEVVVLFVRDQIAAPALGKRTDTFLPFLLTLFVFVLGMNLSGLTPVESITQFLTHHRFPVGFTPTSILTVCFALAALALLTIFGTGLLKSARHSRLPLPLALVLSPVLWFLRLAPPIPGIVGKILCIPLAFLELVGVVAKCFALMIRLFANMISGHMMLAVLMMFITDTLIRTYQTAMDPAVPNEIHFFYVGPICILGSVLMGLMELLVAVLQAYIYTFLMAIFLGLYGEGEH